MRKISKPELEKKRYILIEFLLHTPNYLDLKNEIRKTYMKIFGKIKYEESNIKLIKNLYTQNKAIIQVKRNKVIELKFSLIFIRNIKNKGLIIKTSKVYGTLKKHKKLIKQ